MKRPLLILPFAWIGAAGAQEALVTYRALSPEIALELARKALVVCQERGFQVAVAVVDRFGQPQVMLRTDSLAHTRRRLRRARPRPR